MWNIEHIVNDPKTDGNSRGVRGAGFDTPTQQNLEALFDVMHDFVRNYLAIYYPDTKAIRNDKEVMDWLDELNVLLPKGFGVKQQDCHVGRVGADAGGPTVFGDRAARDPRQFHVELSAVDASPASADISRFSA